MSCNRSICFLLRCGQTTRCFANIGNKKSFGSSTTTTMYDKLFGYPSRQIPRNGMQRWTSGTSASRNLSADEASEFVDNLSTEERENLKNALAQYDSSQARRSRFEADVKSPPTNSQKLQLIVINGLPFIGFGFLDNFMMIVCGDYIEQTLGGYMCLSTMAAAGLGNTISDVVGLGSAVYVERMCESIGFKVPPLSKFQLEMKESRRSASFGRILGITIGCLIGMVPLLFIDTEKKHTGTKIDENTH
ncbi:transmembrane protein 65 isoform X2 [Lutzomyia longipalpis]|uniref:transmembrane protein 65 isoform X2 n=1 Tax=Lutzomyia longipalpis TaxID=7200 RepID=UPI0024840079|nr:transmembrane protein 65 isoform X2 [Lutzomyia longipalpis]